MKKFPNVLYTENNKKFTYEEPFHSRSAWYMCEGKKELVTAFTNRWSFFVQNPYNKKVDEVCLHVRFFSQKRN